MTVYSVEYPREDGTWWMGHKGAPLRDPAAYAAKTGARVVEVQTCPVCETEHPHPYDGTCLLG